jgi:hypothetical protein
MSLLMIALVVAIIAISMAIPPIRIEVIGRDRGQNIVKLDGARHLITDEELQHIRDTGQRLPDKSEPVTPTNAIDKIAEIEARVAALEKQVVDTTSRMADLVEALSKPQIAMVDGASAPPANPEASGEVGPVGPVGQPAETPPANPEPEKAETTPATTPPAKPPAKPARPNKPRRR